MSIGDSILAAINTLSPANKLIPSKVWSVIFGTVGYNVSTIASLRTTTGSSGQTVQLGGYYVAGDKGGGPLRYWSGGQPQNTYIDNGGSIIVPTGGDGSGAWLFDYGGFISVRWFGAYGDNSNDDTVAINAAINIFNDVYFPRSTYKVSGKIQLHPGSTIDGQRSNINQTADTCVFSMDIADGFGTIRDITIRNFSVISGTGDSKGFGINLNGNTSQNVSQCRIRDIMQISGFLNGIHLGSPIVTVVENVECYNNNSDGFLITGGGTSTKFINCYANANGGNGYKISGELGGFTYMSWDTCASDVNRGHGYFADDPGHVGANILMATTFVSCGAESNGGTSFYLLDARAVTLTSCQSWNAGTWGIRMNGCRSCVAIACQIEQSGTYAIATAGGYLQSFGNMAIACFTVGGGTGTIGYDAGYYGSPGYAPTISIMGDPGGISSQSFQPYLGIAEEEVYVPYSPSMQFNSQAGNWFVIAANDSIAFTIQIPLYPVPGTRIDITIQNINAAAALGGITFNSVFKMSAAFTPPAAGYSRTITFRYAAVAGSGTYWYEVYRSAADVPNS